MRKRYESPEFRAIYVSAEDVISTSLNDNKQTDIYELKDFTDGFDKEGLWQ